MAEQVLAKCARRLLPFMGLLYLVNYIDRTNAGFAALTMTKDLGFSSVVYGLGAGIFFIGYSLFQVPANLLLERVGARRWIFGIMAAWGLLASANALVRTPTDFYLVRLFLGVAEAGFTPGMFLYLTYWFPRDHLARVTAQFLIALPLSFVVGGPLSSLILGMDGWKGLHGWQWLFLVEGVPAIFIAFTVLRFLPNGPEHASWLAGAEKDTIAECLAAGKPPGRPDFWPALRDPRLIALAIANLAFSVAAYGIYLWLPQIVKAMGFSNITTGFVVASCFVAAIPAMFLTGRSSSRNGERIWHAALPWLLTASCLAVASLAQCNVVVLAALAVGLAASFAAFGAFFSLPSTFLRGTAAAGGLGLFCTLGNFGGFFGPTLTGMLVQGSGSYRTGFAADAAGYALAALIVIAVGRSLGSCEVASFPKTLK